MIINLNKLSEAELTEVSQDLSKIITKKKNKTGAAFMFWHNLLKGIISETDKRIESDLNAEGIYIIQ